MTPLSAGLLLAVLAGLCSASAGLRTPQRVRSAVVGVGVAVLGIAALTAGIAATAGQTMSLTIPAALPLSGLVFQVDPLGGKVAGASLAF